MSEDKKRNEQPPSGEDFKSDYLAWKAEMLKKSRFTPEVEEQLRGDKFYDLFHDLSDEPRPHALWKSEKWRQLIGKRIDPDLCEYVIIQLEREDAIKRAWDDLRSRRVTYEDFVKTVKEIAKQKSADSFTRLCNLAFQSRDSEFFRAVAETLDFVCENGIPVFNTWKPDAGEEGEFLFAWAKLTDGNPMTREYHFPSLNELWLAGCDRFGWDKGRWKSGDNSAKMQDRLRKFLERRGLPYRKAPR